ncbi:MAG: hypothetical protein M3350_10080, partial [Actinomycetota bacterium]|nr:hypothetical protein [Actinomycetota bacterium]
MKARGVQEVHFLKVEDEPCGALDIEPVHGGHQRSDGRKVKAPGHSEQQTRAGLLDDERQHAGADSIAHVLEPRVAVTPSEAVPPEVMYPVGRVAVHALPSDRGTADSAACTLGWVASPPELSTP